MSKDDLTMEQYLEMSEIERRGRNNARLAVELEIANEAKNELYRQLYWCQQELRETKKKFGEYVDNTIGLARRLNCRTDVNIWESIEREFNLLRNKEQNEQTLLGDLLVLPPEGTQTSPTPPQEYDESNK